MRTSKIISAITLVSSFLIVPSLEAQLQAVASAGQTEEINRDDEVDADDDDLTCSLDPSSAGGDCPRSAASDAYGRRSDYRSGDATAGLAGRVVPLTDDSFDDLTSTHHPSTWLIMFKTDSCGICKKVAPVLEALAVDGDIVGRNDGVSATKTTRGGSAAGPIYVATIDAGWSGADTAKRFGVDATPTIILLRSEGRADGSSNVDPGRSYYVYREQRAVYPLRKFALGGYEVRKRIDVPPPLSDAERKPRNRAGRLYEYYLSPGARWAGGVTGKILLAWFGFMGILGLSMRVHNYAWGGDDDGDDDADRRERREREIECERARGREGYEPSKDEKTANRQRIMWERKEANRVRFAARQEARKAKGDAGDEDDDDEMKGEVVSVKKADAKKVTNDAKKKT